MACPCQIPEELPVDNQRIVKLFILPTSAGIMGAVAYAIHASGYIELTYVYLYGIIRYTERFLLNNCQRGVWRWLFSLTVLSRGEEI